MVGLIVDDDVWDVVGGDLTGGRNWNDLDRFFCGVCNLSLRQQPLTVAQEPADNLFARRDLTDLSNTFIDQNKTTGNGLPRTSRHDYEDALVAFDQGRMGLVPHNDLEISCFFVTKHLLDLIFVHHNRHRYNSSL
ncbi:hypothetical protein D3C75_846620 [compost metagenome]